MKSCVPIPPGRCSIPVPAFFALLSVALACWMPLRAFAAEPVVSNVRAVQRAGTKLVDILYDVADADGDTLTVSVSVSSDGGSTYGVPALTMLGPGYGFGVTAGNNRHIVWNAGRDWPNWYSTTMRVRVTASDGGEPPPEGMVLISAGTFTMGDTYGVGTSDERPIHDVYVSAFYMDRKEVTNRQMADVLQWGLDRGLIAASTLTVKNQEGNPQELLDLDDSHCEISFTGTSFTVDAGREDFPCVEVSWYGAQAYCNYRSDMEGLDRCIDFADWSCDFTRNGYRLPTEAEWEKAARGGLQGNYYPWPSHGGSYEDHIDGSEANYWDSGDPYDNGTTPVGYYDAWGYGEGLYDMAGNVWEWCYDWYDADWYDDPGAADPDPTGPSTGDYPVIRGGSWNYIPFALRCAYRLYSQPSDAPHDVGFRCARGE